MVKSLKGVTIEPVQSAHGAKPHESFLALVNTGYLVIGESLVNIQVCKMPGCGLLRGKQQNTTHTNRQQKQGFGKTFQIGQHTDGKYTKTSPALKAFGKLYFEVKIEAAFFLLLLPIICNEAIIIFHFNLPCLVRLWFNRRK
jgi:hypothetical protein